MFSIEASAAGRFFAFPEHYVIYSRAGVMLLELEWLSGARGRGADQRDQFQGCYREGHIAVRHEYRPLVRIVHVGIRAVQSERDPTRIREFRHAIGDLPLRDALGCSRLSRPL